MEEMIYSLYVNGCRINDEKTLMTRTAAEAEAQKFIDAGFNWRDVVLVDETTMEEIHV